MLLFIFFVDIFSKPNSKPNLSTEVTIENKTSAWYESNIFLAAAFDVIYSRNEDA